MGVYLGYEVPGLTKSQIRRRLKKIQKRRKEAEAQQLGNLRYSENESRLWPETILNRMVDDIRAMT